MKKYFFFLAVLVSVLALFTGCAGDGNGAEADGNGTAAVDPAERGSLFIEGSEGVTITVWTGMNSTLAQYFTCYSQHPYFIWKYEQTGLNVEFVHPTWDQKDLQLTMMIASGDFFDVHVGISHPAGPQVGINEGVFIDLLPLAHYMPDYMAALFDTDGSFADWEWGPERALYQPEPQGPFAPSMFTANGELWAVSQIWTNAIPPSVGPVIRQDWLDDAGLAMPETLDELEVVLEAFRDRGPEVVPMNLQLSNIWDGAIASAFDIRPGWWSVGPGRVVQPYAYVMPQFRDYLELLSRWFANGLIDPDFPNRSHDELFSMFVTDRLGVFFATWHDLEEFRVNYIGTQNFTPAAMPLPRKTRDQQLTWRNFYQSSPTNFSVITTSNQHPEITAQWLNVGFTREGILRGNYGTEGVTFELRNGAPFFTEYFFARSAEDQDFWRYVENPFTGFWSTRGRMLINGSINDVNEVSESMRRSLVWSQNATPSSNIPFLVFPEGGFNEMRNLFVQAKTFADPIVYGLVMGVRDWAEFDTMVQTAAELGFNEARDLTQAALDATGGY